MTINSAHPMHGGDAYWQSRREAFRLIRDIETAITARNRAPHYLAGPSYDAEDEVDDVIENIGPWDRVAELQDRAQANPIVVAILTAQRRLELLTA